MILMPLGVSFYVVARVLDAKLSEKADVSLILKFPAGL
jgi:hypothetical protein